MGSIAAGGRYDNLVAMFTSAAAGEAKKGMPCVGISIGMDRIFALVWPKWVEKGMRSKEVMVYVMAAGDGLLKERMELVQELREAGIKVSELFITDDNRVRYQWLIAVLVVIVVDRLLGQEQAKTARPVRCRRTRRSPLRDHSRRRRAEGWAREGQGAEMAARRREKDEGRVV